MCETDPQLIKLRNAFHKFTNDSAHFSNESLLAIRKKLTLSNEQQIKQVLAHSESDTLEHMDEILASAEQIKKSSKTIASIESLLKQRHYLELKQTDFLRHLDVLRNTIQIIDKKERALVHVQNIIQNVSKNGELSDEFKDLLQHIVDGGSIDDIEEKFQLDTIELASDNLGNNSGAVVNKYLDVEEHEFDIKYISRLEIFLRTLNEHLHSPVGTSWALSKKRVLFRLKN